MKMSATLAQKITTWYERLLQTLWYLRNVTGISHHPYPFLLHNESFSM